ncbi:hypothetical protein AAG570_008036 [Ranatra chinensis]|uniref:Glycosyltransferase 61 catalytic domain-containing protein n=1 Tax=Ranatra chinensis TaxID=642074 RepID=A0ABD0Y6V2_9HEMI
MFPLRQIKCYFIFYSNICNNVIFIGLLCIYICYVSNIKERNIDLGESNLNNEISSSLWCQASGKNDKKCSFKNLCYNPDFKFLFVLTNSSVLSGIERNAELKKIKTSSVFNHNDLYLKLSIISGNNLLLNNVSILQHPVFLLHRFKPDNIMHVIHDDLLPLYLSYSELCSGDVLECASLYSLVFIDEFKMGTFKEWYTIFSHNEPFSLKELNNKNTICFRHGRTGMLTDSVFFQYGFNMPQGPKISNMTGIILRQFSNYILNSLGIPSPTWPQYSKCTLISRKINRKILNECKIEEYVADLTKQVHRSNITVMKVDVSCNSTIELLSAISTSNLLIGMHGSAMILAIFLPEGASVVELFPLGISPEAVSPLNTVSHFPGIYFSYLPWKNENEKNSFVHPEYPPILGGVNHLSPERRNEIINLKNIPPVLCCHDTAYLYRMYQDTIVDDTLIPVLKKAIRNWGICCEAYDDYLDKVWFFPAPVRIITCSVTKTGVQILWERPHNVEERVVHYKLTLSTNGQHFSLSTTSTFLDINTTWTKDLEVWALCSFNGAESIDTYTKCYLQT